MKAFFVMLVLGAAPAAAQPASDAQYRFGASAGLSRVDVSRREPVIGASYGLRFMWPDGRIGRPVVETGFFGVNGETPRSVELTRIPGLPVLYLVDAHRVQARIVTGGVEFDAGPVYVRPTAGFGLIGAAIFTTIPGLERTPITTAMVISGAVGREVRLGRRFSFAVEGVVIWAGRPELDSRVITAVQIVPLVSF
jgi:hypothetical protein